MAKRNSTRLTDRKERTAAAPTFREDVGNMAFTDDPIVEAQNRVFEAKALIQCIDGVVAEEASTLKGIDIVAALSAVIRILDRVGMDLDPGQFRKLVMANSEAGHV